MRESEEEIPSLLQEIGKSGESEEIIYIQDSFEKALKSSSRVDSAATTES